MNIGAINGGFIGVVLTRKNFDVFFRDWKRGVFLSFSTWMISQGISIGVLSKEIGFLSKWMGYGCHSD